MQSTILIADDDQDILEAVKLMLEVSGYQVQTEDNGKHIIKRMKEMKPSVLLLDIWMSGVNGLDVSRKIKQEKDIQHIPVILVSASNDVRKDSKTANADDYLAKPFEMDDLLRKIQAYTQKTS